MVETPRINSDYLLEQKRDVLVFRNPADFEEIVHDLRKAGLSE